MRGGSKVSRTQPDYNPDTTNGRILLHGTYIGIVKNNDDPQNMGRLQVYIVEIGGDPTNPNDWITVGYCSPFAGATSIYNVKKGDKTMAGSQTTYGFWAVPPDLENQVLVQFANGDVARGFWTGCIWQQNMNQMVPGIAAGKSDDPSYSNPVPVTEYNKRDEQNTDQPAGRPTFTPLANGITNQGLINDPVRGTTTASARRGGVSNAYGMLSPRGHQMYIDDDQYNEYFRIRTRSGTQILVNETTGMVYINSKGGNAWMEISDAGVDIYSKNSVSLRAEQDFNVRADNNMIFDAGGSIYMKTGVDLNIQTAGQIIMGATGNLVLSSTANATLTVSGNFLTSVVGNNATQVGGVTTLKSQGAINWQSGSNVTTLASGSIMRQAATITDNPGDGSVPSAPPVVPNPAKVPAATSAPDVKSLKPTTLLTIVNRLPTHEPWVGHPTASDDSSTKSSTSLSAGSGSSSSGSSSSSGGSGGGASAVGMAGVPTSSPPGGNNPSGVAGLPANANTVVSQYSGTSVGNGQCVALVKAACGLGPTSTWKQGDMITPDNVGSIPAGSPIATFQNGKYNNYTNGDSHAAIFLGAGTSTNGQPGITVFDQWSGHAASTRVLTFNNGKSPCNNGSDFSTVNT